MLKPPELLKIELMANGMKITEKAKNELTRGGKIPLSLFEYATTSGIPLQFHNTNIFINSHFAEGFCKNAKAVLDFNDNSFSLNFEGKSIRVESIPLPSYFDKKNKKGKEYGWFAMTHTDRVRISPIAGCSFSCQFCDLSYSSKYKKRDVNNFIESIEIALEDPILPAKHILISGGNPLPKDEKYIDRVYKKIIKSFDEPVDIMMVARKDINYVDELYSWGVNELSVNLELFNQEIAGKLIIGKNKISQQGYFNFLKRAVEVFGKNNVRSILLIGLEPIEDTLKGVEALSKIGVSPVLSPFQPSPKTPLSQVPPPNKNQLIEAYEKSLEIVKKWGVKLGPKCIPCHHNTLTFPDGSEFYEYTK
ncbi:MAG: radical SAM protein [Nanoarchaeota archaeon]|nr:radical SAM protein [Nanoarchaeota archaeon]MBU1444842.1 radical SAM protein [Nanoarchaeota archaeon]MBU2406943.1 radical SAM protein [Nanoarchaeota archaeon]MBU2420010.1 radical SAM protein [Nanoarchaeota archaeon]MBU2475423.1 radical SAM protein [Nanoarchaeota archaeon]